MPALSSIDLAMFMLESPERPFNIGPLVLLRPPEGFKGNFADKLHAKLLQRTPGAPFTYQLKMSLTRAPAVEPMAKPDIAGHVHRLTLANASMEELLEKVCALHETVLDRSGMLWQFYIIDGLADGRVALYGKVHHGIIDGRTFVMAVTQWMSDDPKDKVVRAMWDGVGRPGARAEERAGIVKRLMDAGGQAAGMVRSAAGVYGMLADQGLRSAGLGKGLPFPFLKVPGAFEGKLSARRSYAFCTLPLAEIKALGKAHGATVNDLLLTVLDMAMHRYLGKRAAALRSPLVADMPVALAAGAKGGNQIAVLQFPLGGSGGHAHRAAGRDPCRDGPPEGVAEEAQQRHGDALHHAGACTAAARRKGVGEGGTAPVEPADLEPLRLRRPALPDGRRGRAGAAGVGGGRRPQAQHHGRHARRAAAARIPGHARGGAAHRTAGARHRTGLRRAEGRTRRRDT